MGCNSCAYLKISDKKEGKTNGAVYYCAKKKCYVNGENNACSDYGNDYSRKVYQKDEIFHDDILMMNIMIFIYILMKKI